MQTSIKCRNCGNTSDLQSRYCSVCGKSLFLPLTQDVKNKSFAEIFNSVFNLLTNKDNPLRAQYINPEYEKVIFLKGRKEHDAAYHKFSFQRITFGLDAYSFNIQKLFSMYNSNRLSGYALRITEELMCGVKFNKNADMNAMFTEYVREYQDDDATNQLELCAYALLKDEKYKRYILFTADQFDKQLAFIWSCNYQGMQEIMSDTLSDIFNSPNYGHDWVQQHLDEISQEVYNDTLFGYCLKLVESFYYKSINI